MQKHKISYKEIWTVSWPILIGLFAENVVGVVDTAFLGRVGEIELGASALASTFYIILFAIGMGFGTGVQILVSRRNGQERHSQIGKIIDNGYYFVFALSTLLVFFVFLFAEKILGALLTSPELVAATTTFLKIRVFTLYFSLGSVLMRSFFVGITYTKYIGICALLIGGSNLVMDYVFIFGHWGFPEMGLAGAALASVLCEVFGFAFFIWIILKKMDVRKYRLFRFRKPNFDILKDTMGLSLYTMLQQVISLCGWFLFFVIIEQTGKQNLAISNIIRSFYILLILPSWAFGSAVSTLVSNAMGAGHTKQVPSIIRRVINISLLTAIILIIPCLFLPKEIMGIYTTDATLIHLGYKAIYTILIATLINAVSGIAYASISATGNTRIALFLEIITIGAYLGSLQLLAKRYPDHVEIAWGSEIVYYVMIGILSFWYLRAGKWRKTEI